MESVTVEELSACVLSVARGCKGCLRRGGQCRTCDRMQCRMLADRMEGRQAAPAATPEQVAEYTGMPAAPKKEGDTRWTNYSRRVFAAGQVRRLGPSAYPDGMPCKACRSVKPTGGCGAMALKERCKAYRVWVKAQRAAAAAEGGAQ